jgi:hypothetical protein
VACLWPGVPSGGNGETNVHIDLPVGSNPLSSLCTFPVVSSASSGLLGTVSDSPRISARVGYPVHGARRQTGCEGWETRNQHNRLVRFCHFRVYSITSVPANLLEYSFAVSRDGNLEG